MKSHKEYGIRFLKNLTELSKDFYNNFNNFDIDYYESFQNAYRMRIGKYRAIFTIENEEIKIINVIDINSRGDIYKK